MSRKKKPDLQFVICGFSDEQVELAKGALKKEFGRAASANPEPAPQETKLGHTHFAAVDIREYEGFPTQFQRAQRAIEGAGVPMIYPQVGNSEAWSIALPVFNLNLGKP